MLSSVETECGSGSHEGFIAESTVSIENLECYVLSRNLGGILFAHSFEIVNIGSGDNNLGPAEFYAEVLNCEHLAILGGSEECVVDDLSNFTTGEFFSVSNAGDTFGKTEFYCLLDVSPRPVETGVTESTNNHGESVLVGDTVVRTEGAVAVTFDDLHLVSVGDSAVEVSSCAFDISEDSLVFRILCPSIVIYPTGSDTGYKESHLVAVNVCFCVKLAVVITLVDAIGNEEVDSLSVFANVFNVFADSNNICGSFVNDCVVSENCGCRGCGHEEGKNERKNLILHLFSVLLINK